MSFFEVIFDVVGEVLISVFPGQKNAGSTLHTEPPTQSNHATGRADF